MSQATDFDVGPLTWVKPEIDVALKRASDSLVEALDKPGQNEPLRFAQNHIHQASGALSIVGLDGVSQFSEAIDKLLSRLVNTEGKVDTGAINLAQRALAVLSNYLNELLAGGAHQSLRLFPLYHDLTVARGEEAPLASELFFPNLNARPALAANQAVDPSTQAHELRVLRGRFEKGLLGWIRQSSNPAGAQEMLAAVQRLEQIQVQPSTRAFWWAAIGFFEGLAHQVIPVERATQRLCRRIDTQMRRLMEGSQVVAERLVRDVLYYVAIADIHTQHVQAVRQVYRLDDVLPDANQSLSDTLRQPLAASVKESLEHTKDAWNRFSAGAAVALPQFVEQLAETSKRATAMNLPPLDELLKSMSQLGSFLQGDPLRHNEAMSMEVATGLLVIEQAVESPAYDRKLLDQQSNLLSTIYSVRSKGGRPPAMDDKLFGEAAQRAQERLLFNQFAREILTNLGQIEQTLDAFFRNHTQREPLTNLATPLKQIEGALSILGESKAAALVQESAARVAAFAAASSEPSREDCDEVAQKLSALGFYVEALKNGPAKLEYFLDPTQAVAAAEETAAASTTVEAQMRRESREVQQLVEALKETPQNDKLRDQLVHNLEVMREDAHLVANTSLEQQTREALATLKAGGELSSDKVQEALANVAPTQAPQHSEETLRLMQASTQELDAELLEIFLEEATEVVATQRAEYQAAQKNPSNQEPLITIRRGFHTLKGSSRMVGLEAFAEAGKHVEMTMNRWLQLERKAEPEVLALIHAGLELFEPWIAQLKAGGSTWRDASALINHADDLLAALDPDTARPPSHERAVAKAPATALVGTVDTAAAPIFSIEPETPATLATAESAISFDLDDDLTAETPVIDTPVAEVAASSEALTLAAPPEEAPPTETLSYTTQHNFDPVTLVAPPLEFAKPSAEPALAEFDLSSTLMESELELFANGGDLGEVDLTATLVDGLNAEEIAHLHHQVASVKHSNNSTPVDINFADDDETEMDLTASNFDGEQDLHLLHHDVAPDFHSALARSGLLETSTPTPTSELATVSTLVAEPLPAVTTPVEDDFIIVDEANTGSETSLDFDDLFTLPAAPAAKLTEVVSGFAAAVSAGAAMAATTEAAPLPVTPPVPKETDDFESDDTSIQHSANTAPALDFDFDLALDDNLPPPDVVVTHATASVDEAIESSQADNIADLLAFDLPAAPVATATTIIDTPSQAAHTVIEPLVTQVETTTPPTTEDSVVELSMEDAEEDAPQLPVINLQAINQSPTDFASSTLLEALSGFTTETEPLEADGDINIGGNILSRGLFDLYIAESAQHLVNLHTALSAIQHNPLNTVDMATVRAAHTLAGISGTARFESSQLLAKALENALLRLHEAEIAPSPSQRELLQSSLAQLEAMQTEINHSKLPLPCPELVTQLNDLRPEHAPKTPHRGSLEEALLPEETTIEVSTPHVTVAATPASLMDDIVISPLLTAASAEPQSLIVDGVDLSRVQDELDDQLLPIFFEEVEELNTGISQSLRDWQQNPQDNAAPQALARHFHTLKGSARMSGAMRLGEYVHHLESDLEKHHLHANPNIVEHLESGMDRINQMIEHLRDPQSPSPFAMPIDTRDQDNNASVVETAHEESSSVDELDEQLLPILFEEAEELDSEIQSQLRAWRANPADPMPEQALARVMHTLKGSARMAGAMRLGDYVHMLESRLTDTNTPAEARIDMLEHGFDYVGHLLTNLQNPNQPLPTAPNLDNPAANTPAVTLAPASLVAPAATPATAAPALVKTPATLASSAHTGEVPAALLPQTDATEEASDNAASTRAMLRVRADMVDRFVNEAGEISIARTRVEGEMRTLRRSLLDLTENVIRLRNQLREIEIQAESQMQSRIAAAESELTNFDPLEFDRFTRLQELTRMMAESVGDVTTVQQNLLRNLDASDSALHAQGRLSRDLQQALMGVRMVPFNDATDRLYRVVRQTARELGKRANLDIIGGNIEIDRSVLDRMIAPLEHLLRNALAHGIEMPEERRNAGKSETGQITLRLNQLSNEVALEMQDDGRGLNFDRIAARARKVGLITENEEVSENRLTQLIFEPGFSTAESVTGVAGRGVGMDVVKNEALSVGGRIDVYSETDKGARFLVHLPLTLAVTQSLLVRATGRTYAIPSNMVEQAIEVKAEALAEIRARGYAEWKDQKYPLRYLPRLLGDVESQPEESRFYWILLLRAGSDSVGLLIDELIGNQEIVVKNAGPQFVRLQGYTGATVLPDGEISLILNPVVMAGRNTQTLEEDMREQVVAANEADYVPTIMVVDDSLTVRKITTRLLDREGYNVVTAKDGVDALEQLGEIIPDVMLSDIEMPRMDGFDLARNVRADARLKGLPIIMITSRMADKHRNYAQEIGVDHYLGKPFQEDQLLELIRAFIHAKRNKK